MKTVIRFSGGFRDGQVVTGPETRHYLFLTDDGRVGARFRQLPDELQERMEDLLIPPEQREVLRDVQWALWQDPKLRAMLTLVSKNPDVREAAFWETLRDAYETVRHECGSYKHFPESLSHLKELQEQLSLLGVHHVYEVKERLESEDGVVIHVSFVGDGNTATVE